MLSLEDLNLKKIIFLLLSAPVHLLCCAPLLLPPVVHLPFSLCLHPLKQQFFIVNLSGSTVWKGLLFVCASAFYDKAVVGEVLCTVVWRSGVVEYCVIQCGTVWYSLVLRNAVWHNVVKCGIV